MTATQQDVQTVMDDTVSAYMADEYGEAAMRAVARFLLRQGHSTREAAAIMLSKHLRWADDSEGRGNGHLTNSAAFIRYYNNAARWDWIAEGKQMAAETFDDDGERW